MLGDTQKVLRGFAEAGYQVVEADIETDAERPKGSKSKSVREIGWRVLTGDSRRVGAVIPTPAPRRLLGKTLCFGEPWFHTEPEAVAHEYGREAVHAAARILSAIGRGGVFHEGKVWHAAGGNGIDSLLRNGGKRPS